MKQRIIEIMPVLMQDEDGYHVAKVTVFERPDKDTEWSEVFSQLIDSFMIRGNVGGDFETKDGEGRGLKFWSTDYRKPLKYLSGYCFKIYGPGFDMYDEYEEGWSV